MHYVLVWIFSNFQAPKIYYPWKDSRKLYIFDFWQDKISFMLSWECLERSQRIPKYNPEFTRECNDNFYLNLSEFRNTFPRSEDAEGWCWLAAERVIIALLPPDNCSKSLRNYPLWWSWRPTFWIVKRPSFGMMFAFSFHNQVRCYFECHQLSLILISL